MAADRRARKEESDRRLSDLIDVLNDAVNQSGVGNADATTVLLNLALSKAICGKVPSCTWGQLKRFLLVKFHAGFDAMVKITEAGRPGA